jgi:hypothetical protein
MNNEVYNVVRDKIWESLSDDELFATLKTEIKKDDHQRKKEAINNTFLNTLKRVSNEIFGRRGDQSLDAGFIYAPYIPITRTPHIEELMPVHIGVDLSSSFLFEDEDENEETEYNPKGFTFYDKYVPKPKIKLNPPFQGIEYDADYVPQNTNRSLVDKIYVDRQAEEQETIVGETGRRYNVYRGVDAYQNNTRPYHAEIKKNIEEMMSLEIKSDILKRYSEKMINGSFYGKVTITDLLNGD